MRAGRRAGDADAVEPVGDDAVGNADATGDADPTAVFDAVDAEQSAGVTEVTEVTTTDGPPAGGWRRVLTGNRALWTIAAVAIIALVAGLVLGRFVISPVDAATGQGAPDPGLVTVPVEFGELSNDITMRGDVAYADAVEVTLDTSSFEGAAVVTGLVPEVGSELKELSVALEVTGRPVIVLPGELPAYRSLAYGDSGPDVVQLKQALAAVGIDGGNADSDVFDEATAAGIDALYEKVGYPSPQAAEGSEEAVDAAREGVRAAEESLASAKAALSQAGAGPSKSEIKTADNQIASIQRQLNVAEKTVPRDPVTIGDLRDQLELAKIQRRELLAARDTSAEAQGVESAREQIADAERALATARQAALTPMPSSEILYLTQLPRRIDAMNVQRGTVLQGAAMTVSGATIELSGTVAQADAELLEVDAEAFFELPDGERHRAVITAIEAEDGGGRSTVSFTPDPLTSEQIGELQGTNVRLEVPVGATEGSVLSVPYAALTAGPGGESRVEGVEGDPREGEDAETRMVTVETGLAADGYVEVTPTEGDLEEGDLVVVGS